MLTGKTFSQLIGKDNYHKLLLSYIFVLLLAALSPGYWFFLITLFVYIIFFIKRYPELRISLFFMLIFAVPNFWLDIPGVFGIRFIMNMSYARFLIITLLLPLLLTGHHKKYAPYRFLGSDILVIGYVFVQGILGYRDNTFTNATREFIMLFIDIYIPYFAISRYITNIEELRQILSIFLLSICILSVISFIETSKYWHLYNEFTKHLQTKNNIPIYLIRSGMLRASTIFYTPIALGLASTMAFGTYLYLKRYINNTWLKYSIPVFILIGLATSLSRGPWIGFVVLLAVYAYLNKTLFKNTFKYLILLIFLVPFLSLTSYWNTFISLLPVVGNVEIENITYRQQLFEISISVLQKYPFFGSPNFIDEPEMQQLIQGQGIIDIVNSYVRIMLTTGVIGLILFISIFITLLISAYKITILYIKTNTEMFDLGTSLIAIICSTLFIISTVSSIDYIPYLYWMFSGLLGSFIIVTRNSQTQKRI